MKGSELQTKVQQLIEAYGYYVINVVSAGKSGTHDLIACIEGRFVSLEVKGTGDTIKELQRAKGRRVDKAGGIHAFIHNIEEVKEIIKVIQMAQIL